jgi:small subunit ribosomal protein S23
MSKVSPWRIIPLSLTAAGLLAMGRQIRPAKVYNRITQEIQTRLLQNHEVAEPPWYRAVYSIPPAEIITRPAAAQLRRPNPRQARPKNIYKPQRIQYPEDKLRTEFYKDHPWELARPRLIVESDGKDAQMLDWAKGLKQPGMALSGES